MQQLTVIGENRLEWRNVAEPSLPSEKAAIVRPVAVGVCDFDRAVVQGRYPALSFPIAIGHEIVADVVEVGAEVRAIKAGLQVVLPLHISCGVCRACGQGRTNSCASRPLLSNYGLGERGGDWGGGMSDLLVVPYADAMVVPKPAKLSAIDCAAVGCNLVDLYRTLAPYLIGGETERVLIVGGNAHNMALYGVVMARLLGATRIDFLDDDESRLGEAEALGARPVPISERSAELYPIVVDCGGDPKRLATALTKVAPSGVCTPVWPYAGAFELPVGAMFLRNATLVTGQPHARALMEPVLKLMQVHGFGSTSIPVEILPWDRADQDFGFGRRKRIFHRN